MEHNNSKTAVLIMDMQAGIVSRLAEARPLVHNVAMAITHARSKHIPVIYVVVGFRPGGPEISQNNKSFGASKQSFRDVNMDEFMKIDSRLGPHENEAIVIKRRVSAFSGSDLEVLLRAYGIQHIILTGCSTSGVILSTTREAADKDYRITILSDCCADFDEEVHQVLTTKVFPRQADVITVDEWTKQ